MKRLKHFLRPWARSMLSPTPLRRSNMVRAMAIVAATAMAGCAASLDEQGVALDQKSGLAAAGATGGATVPASGAPAGTFQPTAQPAAGAAQAADELTKAAKLVSSSSGTTPYKIGPQDVLDISVFKVPELSKTVQVADSGHINLPLVGEVPAAGRTAQDVERELTKQLGAKYLQNPQVTVFVKEYNSQRVTIEGAVKKPGVYPIRGRSTLLQAIATAEGLTEIAQSEVVIFRETNGARTAAKFDIEAIRAGTAQDPQLMQGDTIVVATSALASSFQNLMKAVPLGSFMLLL